MVRSDVGRLLSRGALVVSAAVLVAGPFAAQAIAQDQPDPTTTAPVVTTTADAPTTTTTAAPVTSTTDASTTTTVPVTTTTVAPTTTPGEPPVVIGPSLVSVSCVLGTTGVTASFVDAAGTASGPVTVALSDVPAGAGLTVAPGVVLTSATTLQGIQVTSVSTSGTAVDLVCAAAAGDPTTTTPAATTPAATTPAATTPPAPTATAQAAPPTDPGVTVLPTAITRPPAGATPELAYTGAATTTIGVVGALCVGAGVVLLVLVRRGRWG